jgi:guanylate kinase
MAEQKGKLVILSGPSGVGKSTISRELVRRLGATFSISATTRSKGAGEEDGRDYRFVSREEFEAMLDENKFIEFAEVFGNYYGTPREPVETALAEGKVVILEIDVQGGRQVQKQYPEAISIFILPPRREALLERLTGRARGEDAQARRRRLEEADCEIAAAFQYYDYQVVNDDLEQAIREVIEIIEGKTKEKP